MKYTNHKRTFIINLYKNGESVKEICKRYSVAKSTLYSWLYKEQILINSEKKFYFEKLFLFGTKMQQVR